MEEYLPLTKAGYYASKNGRSNVNKYSTPLDVAYTNNHSDIAKFLESKGGLTMEKIIRMAATRIQALYRSYRIRKSFMEHRDLLLRHERLRRQKKGRSRKGQASDNSADNKKVHNAASFLGHVIEETHKTAAQLKN